MSEEKPTFKVTDRRLFNADGSARDVPHEDEPETPVAPEQSVAAESVAEPHSEAPKPLIESAHSVAPESGGGATTRAEEGAAADKSAGADQQHFLMLVEFVASFAADALGMVDHPGEGRGEVNLPLARQCIDMLAALKEKTRGNLSAEEQQVLDVILSQLRMQYVKSTSAARGQQASRSFTGSDITGGR